MKIFKMVAIAPKWVPVTDWRELALHPNFSPVALQMPEILTFEKKFKMASIVPKMVPVLDLGIFSLSL